MPVLTNGTSGNDTITTGADDDIINGLGGQDIINSGAGNDTVNPGDNTSFDFTDTGAGDDVVILTDTGSGFQAIGFESHTAPSSPGGGALPSAIPTGPLFTGLRVNIDGASNTGIINKGINGTTTITDVQVAMLAEGFLVIGSNYGDIFSLTSIAGGFSAMRGMGGDDTYNIVAGPGTVRLDYRAPGATSGIVADLGTGIVSEDGFGGNDTITGDPLDQIRGTQLDDTILGSNDNDDIRGDAGNDSLTGGAGADTLRGGAGDDVLNPGDNDDFDEVDPGAGNDTIVLSDLMHGHVFLGNFDIASGVTVTVDGTGNIARVEKGSEGTTTLVDIQTPMLGGGAGIAGSHQDDTFNVTVVDGGQAYIRGYGGNDTFNISEDPGWLRLDYGSSSVETGVTADLGSGIVSEDGFGGTDTITGTPLDAFRGTDLGDSIDGSSGDDWLEGAGGNDTISGRGGNDRLEGEDGDDRLIAGGGDDTLRGGAGNDTLIAGDGEGYSEFDGGTGNDLIDFSGSGSGSFALAHFSLDTGVSIMVDGTSDTASVHKGTGGTTTVVGARNAMEIDHLWLFGSYQDDTITATASADGDLRIRGYGGNDTIHVGNSTGRIRLDYDSSSVMTGIVANFGAGTVSVDGFGGSDTVTGGTIWEYRGSRLDDDIVLTERDDRLWAKGGDDTVDGGAGTDTVIFEASSGDATITETASGEIQVVSSDGTDLLRNVEELEFYDTTLLVSDLFPTDGAIRGTPEDDILDGTNGDDLILALAGNDLVRGQAGNDTVNGGEGADRLEGGDGDDSINPGGATDGIEEILAGTGNDTIDLADAAGGIVHLLHDDLSGSISFTYDATHGEAIIDKGGEGSTQVLAADGVIANATGLGRFLVRGSDGDDLFTMRPASLGPSNFIVFDGNAGNDRFDLAASSVYQRVNYDADDLSRGIVADLRSGIVSEDGHGDRDEVSGPWRGDLRATRFDDSVVGSDGDDRFILLAGNDTLDGADGWDLLRFDQSGSSDVRVNFAAGTAEGTWEGEAFSYDLENVEWVRGSRSEADLLMGDELNNYFEGFGGNDTLQGAAGNDTLQGGDGSDRLNGGDGDDVINGGTSEADLRDVVFAGAGNDSVDGGHGNDQIFGQEGNDTLAGGFGADELQGQGGNDVITGGALSDLVFGGAGDDFVNGGFGYDRVNGGEGADRFYHLGIADHGSDWVQDYDAAEGDVLVFGQAATVDEFQINLAHTATPDSERSGDDTVQEAFVIYRPTGQIMWALVDGEGQSSINLQIGGEVFDLLA
ncbi:hypothetical protein ACFORG_20750 [Lutimaribacter marinistellae]|uniref:Ca2+-binding protein, RTX toxin-related n=1 Tax=Lutimaribacter marinistellae TaxID=1820329 RepID=A0ABV7TPL8_9RHOB